MTDSKNKEEIQRVKEKTEDDFEKYIIYISVGGLALSLTFIEKIVPFKDSSSLWVLIFSWIFLALTILINFLSHYYSKHLLDKSLKEIEDGIDEETRKTHKNNRNKKINTVNIITVITLFVGIILLVTFASINAYSMAKNNNKKNQTSQTKIETNDSEKFGRTIPKPEESKKTKK